MKNQPGLHGLRRIRQNDVMITEFLCTLKECRLSNKSVKGKQESKYCTTPGAFSLPLQKPLLFVFLSHEDKQI
jgi:hypothetical protein